MSSLRDHLESVRSEYGALTPRAVVQAAEPEDHPLHARFEWNDQVAGHKYRLVQASELIRSVRVEYSDRNGQRQSVRGYVSRPSVDNERWRAYEPVDEAMSDPFTKKLVLQEFQREWETLKRRYEHLKEFAETILRDVA